MTNNQEKLAPLSGTTAEIARLMSRLHPAINPSILESVAVIAFFVGETRNSLQTLLRNADIEITRILEGLEGSTDEDLDRFRRAIYSDIVNALSDNSALRFPSTDSQSAPIGSASSEPPSRKKRAPRPKRDLQVPESNQPAINFDSQRAELIILRATECIPDRDTILKAADFTGHNTSLVEICFKIFLNLAAEIDNESTIETAEAMLDHDQIREKFTDLFLTVFTKLSRGSFQSSFAHTKGGFRGSRKSEEWNRICEGFLNQN